VRTDELKQNP